MAAVTFDAVGKTYPDGTRAVSDLSLAVADGEFMVLVGPSGCGKTTALRMVAGLESITDGEIRIGDRVVNHLPSRDRDIAMVFQSYALYPHLSVYENIAFALRLHKTPKAEVDKRVQEAARVLGLTPFLSRKPKALSGGQRQRVAMGRAIVRQPQAFLMDEPLSNLDAKLRVQTRAEISRLQSDLGVTTVYVTHDQIEAMTMGDRVAVIRKGSLQQVDPPPEDLARTRLSSRIVRVLSRAPVNIVLAVIGLLWLVPTLGLLLTSLLGPGDIASTGWWKVFASPSLFSWHNYSVLFSNHDIISSLGTTAEIAVGGTVPPILIGALAGYAFAWLEFPGRDWLFIAVIGLLVVPLQMGLIPIFSLYNHFGLFDTVLGLVLFHTAFALPFAIFLLRNFFVGIPRELLEAARIDGASELRIFLRLILPLGLPAIASLAIFQFLWTWNDLLVALSLARNTQPITVAIFSQLRQFGANLDLIAPAAFLSLVIPLTVFFAFQRYFTQGLLAGAVK